MTLPTFKKIVIIVLLILAVLVMLGGVVFLNAQYRTAGIVVTLPGQNKIALTDISPVQIKELLAVEDPNFYHHNGIDLKTPGAGYTTITQALVKIFYYPNGFTPGFLKYRKVEQTFYAWLFNRSVSKDEQLTLFFNYLNLGTKNGQDIIGFAQGGRTYFGKDFSNLTDDEYLALVAMAIAPDTYNIQTHPQDNADRVARIKKMLSGECAPADVADVYYENCK